MRDFTADRKSDQGICVKRLVSRMSLIVKCMRDVAQTNISRVMQCCEYRKI